MSERIVIGDKELLIVYGDNTYHVLDSEKEHETVYTGNYEACLEYCERQEIIHKDTMIN